MTRARKDGGAESRKSWYREGKAKEKEREREVSERKAVGEMEEQRRRRRKRKECADACARGRDGGVVRGKMWLREKSLLAVSSFSEFLLDFYPRC